MTQKLNELFNLPVEDEEMPVPVEVTPEVLAEVDNAVDKIDAALPGVKALTSSDKEMDDLAATAQDTFDEIMALGMNVEPRHSARLFEIAGTMLGHAITAKTAKMNQKLRTVELQLKKAKLDMDKNKGSDEPEEGQGTVISRNELLAQLMAASKDNES